MRHTLKNLVASFLLEAVWVLLGEHWTVLGFDGQLKSMAYLLRYYTGESTWG